MHAWGTPALSGSKIPSSCRCQGTLGSSLFHSSTCGRAPCSADAGCRALAASSRELTRRPCGLSTLCSSRTAASLANQWNACGLAAMSSPAHGRHARPALGQRGPRTWATETRSKLASSKGRAVAEPSWQRMGRVMLQPICARANSCRMLALGSTASVCSRGCSASSLRGWCFSCARGPQRPPAATGRAW